MPVSFSPINAIESQSIARDFKEWAEQRHHAFVETQYDDSQHHLILPDECLVFAGPPRVNMANDNNVYPLGFIQGLSYSETRTVQPVKGLGSYRHIFASTNAPIQGNIQRMMFHGRNLLNALYATAEVPTGVSDKGNGVNARYWEEYGDPYWTNLEDDVFRIPFGLGIVYGSPASMAREQKTVSSEYIEVCVIQNKSVQISAGQTVMMEQVSFLADRVVSWDFHAQTGLNFKPGDAIDNPVTRVNSSLA